VHDDGNVLQRIDDRSGNATNWLRTIGESSIGETLAPLVIPLRPLMKQTVRQQTRSTLIGTRQILVTVAASRHRRACRGFFRLRVEAVPRLN
jgi:hypothetical protein